MIWREKRWLLLGLGTLLVANLVFFVTYRVRFEERVQGQEARLDQTREALQQARAEREAAERDLATYRQIVGTVDRVYDEWWATPQERLTPLILEMRELARRSELRPRSIAYSTDDRGTGDTASLAISFGVSGSYEQVRRLINLIEVSNQFVIIEEIGLGESGGATGDLSLTLRLRTLFRDSGASQRRS
ncbi:MAG TPA: hypothetical protein VMS56_00790 [Thermoanaerobaculia bacterium]|nr:hypothetical protein [Thermoanaerobaculia bacterium]